MYRQQDAKVPNCNLTRKQLGDMARKLGYRGWSSMTKAQLCVLLGIENTTAAPMISGSGVFLARPLYGADVLGMVDYRIVNGYGVRLADGKAKTRELVNALKDAILVLEPQLSGVLTASVQQHTDYGETWRCPTWFEGILKLKDDQWRGRNQQKWENSVALSTALQYLGVTIVDDNAPGCNIFDRIAGIDQE